jgi:hypothetical protein
MATYGETQSEYGITTTIPLLYPADRSVLILGIIFWGDVAGEFECQLNGDIKAGGRTSDQQRTIQLDFSQAPIGINVGDEFVVNATHYVQGLRKLKAVIFTRGV